MTHGKIMQNFRIWILETAWSVFRLICVNQPVSPSCFVVCGHHLSLGIAIISSLLLNVPNDFISHLGGREWWQYRKAAVHILLTAKWLLYFSLTQRVTFRFFIYSGMPVKWVIKLPVFIRMYAVCDIMIHLWKHTTKYIHHFDTCRHQRFGHRGGRFGILLLLEHLESTDTMENGF